MAKAVTNSLIRGADNSGSGPIGAMRPEGPQDGPKTRPGARSGRRSGLRVTALALTSLVALSACNGRDTLLTGAREDLFSVTAQGPAETAPRPNRALPISLPAVSRNSEWRQGIGSPGNRVANAALSSNPQPLWAVSIGEGESRKSEITADPVVAGGRIFTLDAGAGVSAVTPSGQLAWRTDLTPPQDRSGEASGGGLAYADGKLFVASGYGTLTALDPATGGVIWQQKLMAAATGAPTAYGDLVYVTAGQSEAWAIEQSNGRVRWRLSATPDLNSLSGAPSPAVDDQYVIFGFGSGELQAAFRRGGMRVWDALITGRRTGFARANINDITGDPVISGSTVYAGNQSGRMVALQKANGERLWTADEGPMGPVWVAGGSVFLLSDGNDLVRLNAGTGEKIWSVDLPFFKASKPKRQDAVYAHYGPILAGGRIVVASSDEVLRLFDPVSGAMTASAALPGGAASAPVVAGGVLYVVSKDGVLHAYR